jgi:predicted HTH domain antitoxin
MQVLLQMSVDERLLLSLKEKKDEFIAQMMFHHALMLYRKGKVSLGKAAEFAGYDKIAFIHKLQLENEPIFDYENELTFEMADAVNDVLIMMDNQK